MDPSRTPQGHVFYDLIFYCGLQRLRLCLRLFLILVDQIHERTVDRLKLCVVFNGLKEFLAVFLHGLEDADLKILGLIVAELVLVFVLAANIMRMSFLTATLMFIAYSVVNGATLSTIFLVYDLGSIGLTFLVTAGMFGAMSLYGFVTGRDLSSWGNLLTMALVGVILASVVNLFLRSEMLMWIVTYVGILLFVGLTAYDTQTIKRMIYSGAEVDEPMQKMALLGALSLYLDFINLFLYMLRLLGNRR